MGETNSNSEIRFDVFGRIVAVTRTAGSWQADYLSRDGKRRPAVDIAIPAFVTATELARYLADLCHESASETHPDVRRLP